MDKTNFALRRRAWGGMMRVLMVLCAVLTCALAVFLIAYVLVKGVPNLSWELLRTKPSYLDGTIGILPDIISTVCMVLTTLLVVLPVVAFITLRTRKWPDETAPLDPWLRRLIIWGSAFVIGGYDGYYGPGTGTFMMIALVRFAKLDTRHAAGGVKVVNLASNLGSLFTALRAGYVLVGVGLISSVASILGHYIGAGLAIKNGSKIVRPTVIAVLLLLTVKVGSELLFPEFWS